MKYILSFLTLLLFSQKEDSRKVYKDGEFIYTVGIIKNNKKLYVKFNSPRYLIMDENGNSNREELNNAWELIENKEQKNTVAYIGLKILGGIINGNQKTMQWNYYDSNFSKIDEAITGLIENDSRVWLHPPRVKFFKILEINPFPEIRLDKENWTSTLKVGEQWGNKAWKTWTGNATINSNYVCNKKEGIITATSNSKLGNTKLVAVFNEDKGFTKLNYTNIDGSILILDLVKKKE
ncbi:MAG: hypothetical protein V3U92_20765 [Cellulophaga sp.]